LTSATRLSRHGQLALNLWLLKISFLQKSQKRNCARSPGIDLLDSGRLFYPPEFRWFEAKREFFQHPLPIALIMRSKRAIA